MRLLRTVTRAAAPWAAFAVLFVISRLISGSIPPNVTFAVNLALALSAAVYFVYLLLRREIHIGWNRTEFDAVERHLARREDEA